MIELITATQLDYFDNLYIESGSVTVKRDDYIVAETKRGMEMLHVVEVNYEISKVNKVGADGEFIRTATDQDKEKFHENQSSAEEAMEFCKPAIEVEKLDMILVNAKFTLDCKKLVYNF